MDSTASGTPFQGKDQNFVSLTFSLVGITYSLAGLLLLIAPEFFLEYIGRFPPLNRHYMGDAGVFGLAVGVGLFAVRRAPWKHPAVTWLGLLATQLHTLNHLIDTVFSHPELQYWLTDALPNLILSVLYLTAFLKIRKEMNTGIAS